MLAHGWNATAYQILNPGMARWYSAAGDAVAGFVRRHGVVVVAGAPVCAPERLAGVAAELARDASSRGDRVCYFGAEARLEDLYAGSPVHDLVLLGAQPVWHPAHWAERVRARASLRAQLNRARNKGVSVAEWAPARATADARLHAVLHEWLASRGLPPLHFLVEPETLTMLDDRRIFVAERNGAPVGFVVASPVPRRDGWLIEQFVRGRGAANGTTELMIDAAVRALAESGARYVTLGLSPLSTRADIRHPPGALWLRLGMRWVRAHGRRFYNFDGLDAFKTKFGPERWEPVYAIVNERRFSPRTLYATAAAFTGQSPIRAMARAIVRGVVQELRWLSGAR